MTWEKLIEIEEQKDYFKKLKDEIDKNMKHQMFFLKNKISSKPLH